MPRKKSAGVRRAQNFGLQQEAQLEEPNTDLANDSQAAADSSPHLPSEGHPVPGPSSSTILSAGEASPSGSHSQSPVSQESLAGKLYSLTLGPEAILDQNVVLEDPPEDEDDLPDSRNPQSLADPDRDDSLPLPEAGEQEETSDETKKRSNQPIPKAEAKAMLDSLSKIIQSSLHGYGKFRMSSLGDVVLTRLRFMAGTLNLIVENNLGLIDASSVTAVAYCRGEWAARQVRVWIRKFQEENNLPTSVYASWNGSVMEDEDLSLAMREWLRDKGKYVQARDVVDFFGTPAAALFSHLLDGPPSIRTAQRWMNRMGYTWMKERRGQFADGHERDDVVEYRMKYYIPRWIELEHRMRSWDTEGNEIPPKLKEGERTVVIWFHDESTFYAHDRRLTRWVHEAETAALYKKGEGVSLMVADFISADYGWLRPDPELPDSPPAVEGNAVRNENKNDARVIFRAGKNRDGWFGTQDVVQQLARAMAIVKRRYPNEDHVFIFDNATIHTKLPETTPNVNKMTLGPSQKVHGEQIGPSGGKTRVNYAPAVLPDGSIQQLYYPMDHPILKLKGAFKGMAQLLEERGVQGAQKLKLICPSAPKGQGCPPGATNCCARRAIMNQPDITSQKSILQLQAEAEGFSVMYLPKYHCELNPIEQCWGAAKRVYRDSPPSSSEADLRRNMLASLDAVELKSIRRFAARSQRFVHAYRQGLSGSQAAWAAKRYHGHRIVPDAILEAMDQSSSA